MAKVFVLDQKSNLVFFQQFTAFEGQQNQSKWRHTNCHRDLETQRSQIFSLKLSDLWEVCNGQNFCFGPNVKFNLFVAAQPIAGQGYDSVRVLVLKMSILFAQCVDVQGQPHERQVRLGPHSLWCQSLSYDHQPLW